MRQGIRSRSATARPEPSAVQRSTVPARDRAERGAAVLFVLALHAGLFWFGESLLAPLPRMTDAGEDPLLVLLPPLRATQIAPMPHVQPPRAAPARAPRIAARQRDAAPATASASASIDMPVAPIAAEPEPTGLTAIRIDPSALAAPPRTPWDVPAGKAFASRAPALPGQGAQRFKMQTPRSIASTVKQIGRLFGGGGPDDCQETRKNIRDLAVLGADAVAQELEEERRNCRN
ncbi:MULTISPECIES: hypothetical protein [Lysobacter]|uniref:hypothetical protein n=1 Tax=Lysobacter TaxID=68 RepID=UPI001F3069F1|nr:MULTISPECIES: hypothetical protein [Lysobacter]UJB18118.1 hypothetical protein L1A79_17420 [Lysobacter capsici]UJQ28159.1 hypothetical protein L2D09_22465 [Lysobacter gummosus]